MKLIFVLALLLFFNDCVFGQSLDSFCYNKAEAFLDEENIYVFCRGTKSKGGLIAQNFNIKDTFSTHIGIGFLSNNRTYIYHISDTKISNNGSLLIDSIASFLNTDGINYIGIWRLKDSKEQLISMKTILHSMLKKKYYFDFSFKLNNGDTLYCSEFCAHILNSISSSIHYAFPVKQKIQNNFYSLFLKRSELEYYPVDFFQNDIRFEKLYEAKVFSVRNGNRKILCHQSN